MQNKIAAVITILQNIREIFPNKLIKHNKLNINSHSNI